MIGGGPAGSAASTILARAGKKVLVLEKERFPRFHIGESLLPCNLAIFEQMGVLDKLKAAGFPLKYGAQFHVGNGSRRSQFVFRDGVFTPQAQAFQVERAVFDNILLRHSEESGAQVFEGWRVERFGEECSGVTLDAVSETGARRQLRGQWLIDASGRGNLTGNQEGLRVTHPRHRKVALFGHFHGVTLDTGERAGDIIIIRLARKWFWVIPIGNDKVSVGLVLDAAEFADSGHTPQATFEQTVANTPALRERMADAQLIGEFRTTNDFSYFNRRLVSSRVLRVGDAAGFMDPIFSAGVYLAMFSGKIAAETLLSIQHEPHSASARLSRYERRVQRAMKFYWRMIEGFYTPAFMDLFLQPRQRFHLPSAVIAFLAGDLEASWAIRWRINLFFVLIRLQNRWPLVPRISFE